MRSKIGNIISSTVGYVNNKFIIDWFHTIKLKGNASFYKMFDN